jgi:Protein-tyrosine-phosphatase-like, N-terminal domain
MSADSSRLELTTEQLLQITTAARRLQDEFACTFSAETIERYMTDSQTRLEAHARVATWLTDPAGQPIEVVSTIRDDIERRVPHLLASFDIPAQA